MMSFVHNPNRYLQIMAVPSGVDISLSVFKGLFSAYVTDALLRCSLTLHSTRRPIED